YWATNIATELGVDLENVTINSRRQPRFFLIDPALRTGNNSSGLPYNQTNWVFGSVVTNNGGVIVPPLSARLVILSSISLGLPAGITNGVASSIDFNAIWDWNQASGDLPA